MIERLVLKPEHYALTPSCKPKQPLLLKNVTSLDTVHLASMGRNKTNASGKYVASGCALGKPASHCPEKTRKCWYQRSACEERIPITFWTDRKGRRLDGSPPSGLFAALRAVIVSSWYWLLLAVISQVVWMFILDNVDDDNFLFTFDQFGFSFVLMFATFFIVGLYSATESKRIGGGSSWVSTGSGFRNLFTNLDAEVDFDAMAKDPVAQLISHDQSKFVWKNEPVLGLFKKLAIVVNGIMVVQRQDMRGSELDIDRLPIYNEQKNYLDAYWQIDPVEALQGLAKYYISALYNSGAMEEKEERFSQRYFNDAIDGLGNLDVGKNTPVGQNVIYLSNFLLLLLVLLGPLYFALFYPFCVAVWFGPLSLSFFFVLAGFAQNQALIGVSTSDNIFSGISVTEIMYETASHTYNISSMIACKVKDKKLALAAAGANISPEMPPPPAIASEDDAMSPSPPAQIRKAPIDAESTTPAELEGGPSPISAATIETDNVSGAWFQETFGPSVF